MQSDFLIEIAKFYGFPALIFIMWFLYHKSTVSTFNKIVETQSETAKQTIEEQSKREERNFKLLKDMLETNQYHSSLLAKIAQQIESNQWCPFLKKDFPRITFEQKGD